MLGLPEDLLVAARLRRPEPLELPIPEVGEYPNPKTLTAHEIDVRLRCAEYGVYSVLLRWKEVTRMAHRFP